MTKSGLWKSKNDQSALSTLVSAEHSRECNGTRLIQRMWYVPATGQGGCPSALLARLLGVKQINNAGPRG